MALAIAAPSGTWPRWRVSHCLSRLGNGLGSLLTHDLTSIGIELALAQASDRRALESGEHVLD